jgi:tRNA (cytosine34-C5)-methyltransferase
MYGQHIRKTMFPPSKADAERLNLERCWRMLPHDQDTGGFFVALLKKVKPLEGPKNAPQHVVKSTSEKIFASKTAADKSGSTAGPSGEGSSKVDEDTPADEKVELQRAHPERAHGQDLYAPFMQNEANHASLESIREFYGLKSDFPVKNLFTRSVGGKIVSYVNDAVQYHTMDFEHKGRRAHLVNVGIKVFEKNTRPGVDCPYRLQQDGIGALLPHLTKRVMKVTLQDMAYLLQPSERGFPLIAVSAHSKEQFKNAGPGSCALVLDTSTFECSAEKILAAGLPKDFPIVCWKGEVALSPLVHKHDRGSLYNVVKTAAQELGMPLKDLRDFVYPEKSESAVGEVNQ